MRLFRILIAWAALAACFPAASSAQTIPWDFFGVAPQATVTEADAAYMHAGGIESVRVPVAWPTVEPSPESGYQWQSLDATVATAARARMQVLPFLYRTPPWLSEKLTTLPVDTAAEREDWEEFVRAAVERYGPAGNFWTEHGPFSADPVPRRPIRTWQVWNEANFFYFAYPVSPQRYARLLKITTPTIKELDPGARVILSGLFGEPDEGGGRGMPAERFLARLYAVPGITSYFDGVSLHPYASDLGALERMVEGIHRVVESNHDDPGLYITEMGWGSQPDPNVVSFELGLGGQARQVRQAYEYLIGSQRRLHLMGVYWFSWKDLPGSCSFCDSVGFFRAGPGFSPKPAWRAFVAVTGGRARPQG